MKKRNLFLTKDDRESDGKISFFENIFYWLWYYSVKVTPKNGRDPEESASGFFTGLRILNLIFLLYIVCLVFNENYFKLFTFIEASRLGVLLPAVVFAFAIDKYDTWRYLNRYKIIIEKFDCVAQKKRQRYFFIFLGYVIASIGGLMFSFLTLESSGLLD